MLDTVKKANSSIGFLRQNLQIHQKHIKANVYKALLWPQNGYASTMWDPFTQENQNKIDIVQRRAARFAWNNYRCEAIVMRMHVLWAKWVNEIWKNNIFGRNNKIKHYFYYFIAVCTCKAYFWHEISTWTVCYQYSRPFRYYYVHGPKNSLPRHPLRTM